MLRWIRSSLLLAVLAALPLAAQMPPPPTPFLGAPVSLPGVVQAEDFDNGGQNVAYYDATPGNAFGSFYRTQTDVDIGPLATGGYHLGVIAAGEWTRYLSSMYPRAARIRSGCVMHPRIRMK